MTMKINIKIYSFGDKIFAFFIVVSFVCTSTKSFGLIPDFAEIREIKGSGISIGSNRVKVGNRLTGYKDNLAIPAPPFANNEIFADLDLVQIKRKLAASIRAKGQNGSITFYNLRCSASQQKDSVLQIQWSNGKNTPPCSEGMRFTKNPDRYFKNSKLPIKQTTYIAQAGNTEKNHFPLLTQASNDSLRYYCSSIPDFGNGSGKISAGLTSIEEACQESQNVCESKNTNGCSIATMGEWNINDSDLVMSVTCSNGKSTSKRVSGSEINAPGSTIEDLLLKLSKSLGLSSIENILQSFLKTKACYLEVYYPDEILVSPVDNQNTTIETTGLENGISVEVLEGQAQLRSRDLPEGIIANSGNTYIFNGNGNVYPASGRNRTNIGSPTQQPYPSQSPTP
jgi:hypothetical protein